MGEGKHFYQLETARAKDKKIADFRIQLCNARTEVDMLKEECRKPAADPRETLRSAIAEVKTVREKIEVIYSFGAIRVSPEFKNHIFKAVEVAKKHKSAAPYLRNIFDLLLPSNCRQRR